MKRILSEGIEQVYETFPEKMYLGDFSFYVSSVTRKTLIFTTDIFKKNEVTHNFNKNPIQCVYFLNAPDDKLLLMKVVMKMDCPMSIARTNFLKRCQISNMFF